MRVSPDGAVPQAPGEIEGGKKKRKARGRLECELGILLGAAGLVGARLGQLWIAFDVFAQFTVQFIIVTVAFVAGLLMPRAKLLAAFLLIISGLLAVGVWPHVMSRSPMALASVPAGAREIRVASFNTWYSNQDVAAVEAEIARIDADIVTLMEVGPDKKPALENLKVRYPHQANCFTVDYCNLVVLSKFPLAFSEARVGWEGPPYIRASFGPELGNLTVLGVHTIRFPHSRAQFRQVVALSKLIESIPGHRLVMGDFNATPFSRIIHTITDRTGLKRLSWLPSWPSNIGLPQVAIDHVFVSPGLVQTESQQIGRPAGSDHFPVTLKLAVPLAP